MDLVQRRLHEKYGYLIRIGPNELSCADPKAKKDIYRLRNPLQKTDFYSVFKNPKIGAGENLFSLTNEKEHSKLKRAIGNVYKLENIDEKCVDRCSQLFLGRIGELADEGHNIELGRWLHMFAYDTIGEIFFGHMFGFMEHRFDHGSYIESVKLLMPILCIAAVSPVYLRPIIFGFSFMVPAIRRAFQALDNINCAAENIVKTQLETEQTNNNGLLQKLFSLEKKKAINMDHVKMEAWSALFAGADTTAIALCSIFYHLMRNPTAYEKLQVEIDSTYLSISPGDDISFSEARKLPYLKACILEATRLSPSIGLTLPRVVPLDGLSLCGRHIPSSYRVGINPAVIHYDETVFGRDASLFRPERWLEENAAEDMGRYLLNFGAGTRTCIGQNIANLEMYKLPLAVLRRFHICMKPNQAWKTRDVWFNQPEELYVKITRRSYPM
ncbi:cytochrome P450, putative [Talaromyces stipitatus ATCC 10500]|uniref:Cytochrome P450, putative n=1 Tax=Talaromyces stipitatus (strain ATCC 10500 / CBS 375.48 / QM 6759 / NRRL 1006) TaxID=441959 RepID=B8MUG6_TALSN|nr:cytochrome P450, putative [Talaromyces stipitatus ATCC 10500]EED11838.1 cytochrome P450, putative [Talaromyces stipitatus ATCC 10500]